MLERLEINGNHITGLPSEIGALTRLNYLKAQGNMIAALPATMSSMTGLMQSWSEFGLEDSPALMEAWEAIKAEASGPPPPSPPLGPSCSLLDTECKAGALCPSGASVHEACAAPPGITPGLAGGREGADST